MSPLLAAAKQMPNDEITWDNLYITIPVMVISGAIMAMAFIGYLT